MFNFNGCFEEFVIVIYELDVNNGGLVMFGFSLELQLCIGCRARALLYIDMVDGGT